MNERRIPAYLVPLPAILVVVVFAGLIGRALYASPEIANEYRMAARNAIDDGDREKAKFYYSRLIGQGDSGTRQDQFNWASLLAASGDTAAAQKLLSDLAPTDGVGYPPAHLALARSLLSKLRQPDLDTSKLLPELAHHLRRGAWDPSPENDVLWGAYYLAVQQYDKAIARYASAATAKPKMWSELAKLYRQIGRVEDAKRAGERAVTYLRGELKDNPLDTDVRLVLADALIDLDRFEQAETVLGDGLKIASMDPKLRQAAGTFRLMQLNKLDAKDPEIDRKRLQLITRAASISPENPAVYQALSTFYQMGATEQKKAAYRKQLQKMIADGNQVAAAHFALGNIEFMEGNADDAVFHLETAMEIDPSMVVIANNLAWVLSEKKNPDYERAAKLVESALQQQPGQVSFLDTLGSIRFRQKRYREALPLMEKVLGASIGRKRDEIHERLAVIYDSLDKPQLAQSHRDAIQRSVSPVTAEQPMAAGQPAAQTAKSDEAMASAGGGEGSKDTGEPEIILFDTDTVDEPAETIEFETGS